jgi:hypothetical protein
MSIQSKWNWRCMVFNTNWPTTDNTFGWHDESLCMQWINIFLLYLFFCNVLIKLGLMYLTYKKTLLYLPPIMSVKRNGLQQNWFIKKSFSNCWFYIFIIFLKQKTLILLLLILLYWHLIIWPTMNVVFYQFK